ncbi:hypothetical protein GCM10009069_22650 [Algimonas arctica]|uniref:DUF6456 domain-containing protein n=1 Tax=Algimonas arctica TaxID=1479486 RepID=A0A8J3CS63_9PROT|nr:DUF6456 domain-containing protein [Algimonas arctica]GHA99134.1 hypothetical protein GCM10009069_22650 [Algimonas arctica]
MSSEQNKLRTEQLLRSLLRGKALIERQSIAGDWPAYPGGDRRKRPLFWVNSGDIDALMVDGVLVVTDRGVGLSNETRRRLLYGQSAREVVETTEFVPSGVERPVRRNVRGTVILRLAPQTDRQGDAVLSDAQITAAHRYTLDLLRAGEGRVGTVDLSAPKVDGTRRHDAAERAALARLDGHRALQHARSAIGSDLTRLLNAVCGANERLEAVERAETWSRGTGLSVLKIALDLLVRHYGAVPGKRAESIRPDHESMKKFA